MAQRGGQDTMPPCLPYCLGGPFIYFYFLKKKNKSSEKKTYDNPSFKQPDSENDLRIPNSTSKSFLSCVNPNVSSKIHVYSFFKSPKSENV